MIKHLFLTLFLFSVCIFTFGQGQLLDPTLTDIPHDVFVNGGKIDFNKILYKDETIKEKVRILHGNNELSHDLDITNHGFEEYWNFFKNNWHLIKFKESSSPFLIFSGFNSFNDLREYVEIYDMRLGVDERFIFGSVGKLLCYKNNPFTDELVLYVHKYPCCGSASHNIYSIRELYDELKVKDRFFVGRDYGDMVGPFFPETAQFESKYHRLTKKTELRWSPAIVNEKAYVGWSESNLMIHYDTGALYKVLHDDGDWQFVVFFSGIVPEHSKMLNYTNFQYKGVYGWIKK